MKCNFIKVLMMKMKTKVAGVVIGSLALFNVEAFASMPLATAAASFDWSSFTVAGLALPSDPVPTLSWNNQNSYVSATTNSPNDNQSDYAGDWTTALNKTAGNLATGAIADSALNVSSAHDSDLASASSASASSSHWGEFTVAGSGVLLFSVNYSLAASLIPGTDMNNNNTADAGVYFQANKSSSASSYQYFTAQNNIYLNSNNVSNSPLSETGTLKLALWVNNGETYNFYANNYANANVASIPLPAATWLFVSGLMGVVGLTRRKAALTA